MRLSSLILAAVTTIATAAVARQAPTNRAPTSPSDAKLQKEISGPLRILDEIRLGHATQSGVSRKPVLTQKIEPDRNSHDSQHGLVLMYTTQAPISTCRRVGKKQGPLPLLSLDSINAGSHLCNQRVVRREMLKSVRITQCVQSFDKRRGLPV